MLLFLKLLLLLLFLFFRKKSSAKKHKQSLQRLKETDPEFFEFLQKEDQGLLSFNDKGKVSTPLIISWIQDITNIL